MSSQTRVNLDAAWLLHTRSYQESSLLLELFSRQYGRVGLVARGVRRSRTGRQGLLQPFCPLLCSWISRGELGTLTEVERSPGQPLLLRELALRAESMGYPSAAASLWREVVEIRPGEVSAYLALARCNIAAKRPARAMLWFELSPGGLKRHYTAWLRDGGHAALPEALRALVKRPRSAERARIDVRVYWSTDATDVDLHVVEPTGEVCYYRVSPNALVTGAELVSPAEDTDGAGPEGSLIQYVASDCVVP